LSHAFHEFLEEVNKGNIDLDDGDIRAALCMTDTTVDTEDTAIEFLDDFTDLDEHDGTNYARVALTTKTVTKNDGSNRAEFDCDDITWSALGAGTRDVEGILILKHVTDDTDSIPLMWVTFSSVDQPTGADWTITIPSTGLMHARRA
tara:strand:+ start:63 stop:503 length:441 start_codon:yes stop_codon:yes gene_type:complete